jgi:hypothetical protein
VVIFPPPHFIHPSSNADKNPTRKDNLIPHANPKTFRLLILFLAALTLAHPTQVRADDDGDDDDKTPTEGKYFFGLLDHRSMLNREFFIDSFIGPQLDPGTEFEFDYLHGEKRGVRNDEVDAEFEYNPVGQLTIAGEFGWDSQHGATPLAGVENDIDDRASESGLEDVDLAIYHPVFQYVSKDGNFDYTAEVRIDLGIPTRGSPESRDVIITPYLGHLLRLGDHISIEAWTGTKLPIAPHPADEFTYGACLAYVFPRHSLPLPFTDRIAPQIEIDGLSPMSRATKESLFAVAGFDLSLNKSGNMQPHLALGYEFPIDQGARDQLHWAVLAQLVFDF